MADFFDIPNVGKWISPSNVRKASKQIQTWRSDRRASSTYDEVVGQYGPEVAEAAANAVRQGRKPDAILDRARRQDEARVAREKMLANPPPVHGSARWLEPSRLGTALRARDQVHNPRSLMLGTVVDAGGTVQGGLHWDEEGHLLTLAPSRSGKGYTTIIPNLLRYKGAVIVHDPKGELYEETSDWRSTLGPVYRVNPYNAGVHADKARFPQHGFNPITWVETYADARELAGRMLPQDPKAPAFFIEDAMTFLTPLIWFVRNGMEPASCNLATVCQILADGVVALRDHVLPAMRATGRPELIAGANAMLLKMAGGKGKDDLPVGLQTFFATINTKLEFWRDPELARCISRNDVDFAALKRGSGVPNETVTIYVTLPFKLMRTSAPFLRMLFVSALNAMEDGPNSPIPILFLMDEFLSLGPFPEFEAALRTHAGYGVRLWFFLQELGKLQEHYPGTTWQAFFNTSAKQFFGINDPFTGELVSRILSTGTVAVRSTNESANLSAQMSRDSGSASVNVSSSESISLHGRPLLMTNEVTGMLSAWLPNGTRRGIVQLSSLAQLPIEVHLGTYKQSDDLFLKRIGPLTAAKGGYSAGDGPVIDFSRLHHGMWGLRIALVVLTWIALLWAGLISHGAALVSLPVALFAFPAWGMFFGGRGVSKARDKAVKAAGTQLVTSDHWLAQETGRLCSRLGLPARPWVATMPVHNAYAIGSRPDHAMVVIGTPLLTELTREEVAAVIGHELGHIANNDMRRMVLAEQFQKSLTWYLGFSSTAQRAGRWLMSWMAELWVLSLSRKREYWADAIGAALTSREAMRSALVKIHRADLPLSSYESQHARLMFRGKGSSLLSTHPTLDERLAALDSGSHLDHLPYLRSPSSRPQLTAVMSEGALPDARDVAWARPPTSRG